MWGMTIPGLHVTAKVVSAILVGIGAWLWYRSTLKYAEEMDEIAEHNKRATLNWKAATFTCVGFVVSAIATVIEVYAMK